MQKTPLHIMLHRNTFIRNHNIIYIYICNSSVAIMARAPLSRDVASNRGHCCMVDEQETCAAKHLGEAALHAF